MTVRVEATLESSEGDLRWVNCRLVSDLVNSKGEIFGQPRLHHEAKVRLIASSDDLGAFLQSEIDALPTVGTPADGELLHHSSFIYLRYFHGPRFQSHGGVLRGVENGIDGIEWSTMLRVPEADERLRMRSIKVATEDSGVTVHDVVIVGDDDAPVLSLKGLRLKAMGEVPADQRFSLQR